MLPSGKNRSAAHLPVMWNFLMALSTVQILSIASPVMEISLHSDPPVSL
jgi:hypothetical protein